MKIPLTIYQIQLNYLLLGRGLLNHFSVALIFVNKEYS